MEVENVYKVAASEESVRKFLTSNGWEFEGKSDETEMDSYRNSKTGGRVCIEDISDGFPVTFIMGELGVKEFDKLARDLTPGIGLLEVDSSWEGEPTRIVVAMTVEQIKDMFGKRAKMRKL